VGIRRFDLVAAILVSLTVGFSAGRIWSGTERHVIDAFHRLLYYNAQFDTHWLGVPVGKIPTDQWVYQELLWETKPDVLLEMGTLEMGTFKGGSALYYASLFDLIGNGRVITVDIEKQPNLPAHPRITYLTGSSTAPEIVQQIRGMLRSGEKVMAVLDSDHSAQHVRKELDLYGAMVTPGQYIVVEDTNVNGHPVYSEFGPGPAEATADFLKTHPEYQPDRTREKFLVTFFPGGWLKHVRSAQRRQMTAAGWRSHSARHEAPRSSSATWTGVVAD
jgi:cephalosporin hydroxylase